MQFKVVMDDRQKDFYFPPEVPEGRQRKLFGVPPFTSWNGPAWRKATSIGQLNRQKK